MLSLVEYWEQGGAVTCQRSPRSLSFNLANQEISYPFMKSHENAWSEVEAIGKR